MTDVGFVQSLWRYPVRSMRGEELALAEVAARGMLGDRCYCVVDVDERRAADAGGAALAGAPSSAVLARPAGCVSWRPR